MAAFLNRTQLSRFERRAAQVLLGIVALYLILYGIIALILQSHVNHLVEQQLGVPHAFRIGASAWPPGLALRAEGLDFKTELGEIGHADTVLVTVPVFMPWVARTQLTNFSYENKFLRIAIAEAASRTPLYAHKLAQYHTRAKGISVWPAAASAETETTATEPGSEAAVSWLPERALRIASLSFDYQRRIGAHDQANPEEESTVTLAPIVLPTGSAAVKPLQIDQVSLRTTAEPALPRDMKDTVAMAAWQAQGGVLAIAPLTLDALGTSSTLAGPIALDENLIPNGKLTLTFTGLDKAYAALKDMNIVPAEQYAALGNMLQLMPQKGAAPFDFPVSIRDHAVFFMEGAIFELARLPWEAPSALPTDATVQPQPQLTPAPEVTPQAVPTPTVPLTPGDPALPLTPNGAAGKL